MNRRCKSPEEMLWRRVEKTDGCWLWTGGVNWKGYGRLGGGKPGSKWRESAHRLSYRLTYGSIPEGMHVCHRCDVPRCVRPDHLFLGTNTDNVRDAIRKGRKPMHRCAGGHMVKKDGSPCKTCREVAERRALGPRKRAPKPRAGREAKAPVPPKPARRRLQPGGLCRKGHLLEGQNLGRDRQGYVKCQECYRQYRLARYYRVEYEARRKRMGAIERRVKR